MAKFRFFLLFFNSLVALLHPLYAEDATTQPTAFRNITLDEAESLFLQNNYQLLAAKFQIEASRASILQARLWHNPNIMIEQNVYNPNNQRFFDITPAGQTQITVQQLLVLAGKRDYQIKIAQWSSHIVEQGFYDTLRNLRAQLQTTFYGVHYLRQSILFYDTGIAGLQSTLAALEKMYAKRLVLLSEVMRIKSLLFSLQNDRTELRVQLGEQQNTLKMLLGGKIADSEQIQPVFAIEIQNPLESTIASRETIIQMSLKNRPDLQIAESAVHLEETNVRLQHAMKHPDVNLGVTWDKQGNYISNYFGFQASTEIPILNRNEGNIAAAEKNLAANQQLVEKTRKEIERDVSSAYTRAVEKDALYQQYKGKFSDDYANLVELTIKNYQKRYMTALEFADFYESYRNSITTMLKLESERIAALAALNNAVNAPVVKIR